MDEINWDDIAIFVAAPREMSVARFTQLVKHYLPKGNILLGIAKESYVLGFEDQIQFKTLRRETVQPIIDKVADSSSPHKIYVKEYEQAKLDQIVTELTSQRVLLVNGSWHYAFHNLPAYKALAENNISYKFISPFIDESEAISYEKSHQPNLKLPSTGEILSKSEMVKASELAATASYDYIWQTGVVLGKRRGQQYEYITSGFNKVIPYQARVLHEGSIREKHRSQVHDTNRYDTIHAEMMLLTDALKNRIDLKDTTLFVNLLPCPNCARTLSQTDIAEVLYVRDHSEGYAVELLKSCGKRVERIQ